MKTAIALTFFFNLALGQSAHSIPIENFLARKSFQDANPVAFVLEPDGGLYLELLNTQAVQDADALSLLIQENQPLLESLKTFSKLNKDKQKYTLIDLFQLEVSLLRSRYSGSFAFLDPVLEFNELQKAPAYFDFNLNDPLNVGKVILNLNNDEIQRRPVAAISLILHETRHSFQLQYAKKMRSTNTSGLLAEGFLQSFQAQKSMRGFTYMDFYTLTNEYEAFLFGNRVIHQIFHQSVDLLDMGSFAGQFHANGSFKIDLFQLHRIWNLEFLTSGKRNQESAAKLYDEFNSLEEAQRGEF